MLIGLTGGIATGKSTVSRYLQERGAWIVDADRIAHEVVEPGEEGLQQVVAHFGSAVFLPDGRLNRQRLGHLVFSDAVKRKALEQILHPLIRARMWAEVERARTANSPWIVLDVPLLIENGLYQEVDAVILVVVSKETQLARLMERDHVSEEEAKRRIAAQMPLDEKRHYAHFIIDNDGTIEATYKQIDEILAKIE
ncbi:dephospho-CoA kinase [Rubeoparvulum massiliense]|uniref:dephospho-CoA kinase n=1 Tax=Rubeoparvulum massiliense TaxID=1631346 RepID=UPI00065DD1E5|nr:dephospho-CoA kinase [Rubeoparvulum massiliense]